MGKKITAFFRLTALGWLFLAGCGPIQAKEGQIYIAGENGGKVVTVINRQYIEDCSIVPPGTVAYAERKTYFGQYVGNGSWEETPITQVAQTGKHCEGGPDYIEGNPEKQGWSPLDATTNFAFYEKAVNALCSDSQLRDLNPPLDTGCDGWGRKR